MNYISQGQDVVATVAFAGSCTTDASGDCVIEVGETNGVLRGRLDVEGYGSRDVIWPGGTLELPCVWTKSIRARRRSRMISRKKMGAYPCRAHPFPGCL